MRILLLGTGKTGSLVAEVARERGHEVETLRSADNRQAAALTADRLALFDTIIDFTTPHCVLGNIHAAIAAGKNMVVGTTGWYAELASVRKLVEQRGTGFLYGSNFSIGVNLFFDLVTNATMPKKKTLPPALPPSCKQSCKRSRVPKLRSLPSAKETSSGCTNWCSILPMTPSISATTPRPAAGLRRELCGGRSGWWGGRGSSISKMFGGRCR